jgi:quercetin dioxygenase-like cupin family protein
VIGGTIVLMVEGKPPVTVRAGEVFFTERGHFHNARNIGTTTARAVDTYIIDKGKPGDHSGSVKQCGPLGVK